MYTILRAIQDQEQFKHPDGIVALDKSATFLDEDDFWRVIDYLDDHGIRFKKAKSSMTGIGLIELV